MHDFAMFDCATHDHHANEESAWLTRLTPSPGNANGKAPMFPKIRTGKFSYNRWLGSAITLPAVSSSEGLVGSADLMMLFRGLACLLPNSPN